MCVFLDRNLTSYLAMPTSILKSYTVLKGQQFFLVFRFFFGGGGGGGGC